MHLAIIHGYGRVSMENPFYQTYVQWLLKYLEQYHCDAIICSGGFTDKNIRQSEADSLRVALIAEWLFWNVQRYLEEESLTTYQNILKVWTIVDELDQIESIRVYCSNIHLPKIMYQSLQTYLRISKHDVVDIMQSIRQDPQKNPNLQGDCVIDYQQMSLVWIDLHWTDEMLIKTLWSSIIETHYDDFYDLHDKFVEYRKQLRWIA
jgi:hypothetical protein